MVFKKKTKTKPEVQETVETVEASIGTKDEPQTQQQQVQVVSFDELILMELQKANLLLDQLVKLNEQLLEAVKEE
jgi:hypothetical protein